MALLDAGRDGLDQQLHDLFPHVEVVQLILISTVPSSGKVARADVPGLTNIVPVHDPVVTTWPARTPPSECDPSFTSQARRRIGSTAEFPPTASQRILPSTSSRTAKVLGASKRHEFAGGPRIKAPWFA